jgi:hypothetical protein
MFKIILKGQNEMRVEVLAALHKLDKNISGKLTGLGANLERGFSKINHSLDNLEKKIIKIRKIRVSNRSLRNLI